MYMYIYTHTFSRENKSHESKNFMYYDVKDNYFQFIFYFEGQLLAGSRWVTAKVSRPC